MGKERAHGKSDLPLHISISETLKHATFHTKHLMTRLRHFNYYTTFQDGCELKKQMEYFSPWYNSILASKLLSEDIYH